jgi:primary replicative DNA helicase (EC 3.6.1.-)
MSREQLAHRLLSMESEISAYKLRDGKLSSDEWNILNASIERMSSDPIFIDDTPSLNIFELRAKCRRLKLQHNIQLVVNRLFTVDERFG